MVSTGGFKPDKQPFLACKAVEAFVDIFRYNLSYYFRDNREQSISYPILALATDPLLTFQ